MKNIFVKTFGCTLNQKETLEITNNHIFTQDLKNLKDIDLVLVNTCGVKEQTQTKIINFLKRVNQKVPENKIYVYGCLVDIDKSCLKKVLPNANYFSLKEKQALKKILNLKPIPLKKTTHTIILSNGCLGNCNYCAVKFARGKLKSKPIKEIVNEIKQIENAKEICLTSQDNGCYGLDIQTNLVNLLKEILKIKKDFKIRIGMANPGFIKKDTKDLIKVYKHKNVYKFLHIPIQSGSNKVLKEMNRTYKIQDVYEIVKQFRKEIPELTLATDVIVGYPTETNKDFLETIKAIKTLKPDIVHISRFGRRKNIQANTHKDLAGSLKKERSRILSKLCDEIYFENNKKYLNKTYEINFTEKGKNNSILGKTNTYKMVVVKTNKLPKHKTKVKIKKINKNYLEAEILKPKQLAK